MKKNWAVHAVSDLLDGEWSLIEGKDAWEKPFAGINNVTFEDDVVPWTKGSLKNKFTVLTLRFESYWSGKKPQKALEYWNTLRFLRIFSTSRWVEDEM